MPQFVPRWIAAGFAIVLAIASTTAASRGIAAQDDVTPAYPVAIYQSTCDQPAVAPSFELGATQLVGADEDDDEEVRGTTTMPPIVMVDETIDTTYETLLDEQQHVIAIHQDVIAPENIIACGELGGVVEDGRLVVGLRPIGDSGVAGVAILDEDTEGFLGIGEDEVNVRVYLMTELGTATGGQAPAEPTAATEPSPTVETTPTPATTPTAETTPAGSPTPGNGGQAQTEVTVEMVDIAFSPKEFTIPADTDVTVTLPNNGAAVHNFNIDGHNNPSDPGIQSGDVQPGDSTTVTLNLPAGDWYYYCSIPGHEAAGMFGTVHVVEQ